MQIFERSVTRRYWHQRYRIITRQLQSGDYRRVGSSRCVFTEDPKASNMCCYVAVERSERGLRPVGWLVLWQNIGWKAWEVAQLWVFPERRGEGIAKRLYRAAINTDLKLLASGTTHTKHSRLLWESFIRRGDFTTWAHDFNDLRQRELVMWDDDLGVVSRLPLYTKPPKRGRMINDIRLVAIKKEQA